MSRGVVPPEVNNFLSFSYVVNWTAEYGTMRRQLIPFPAIIPRHPSSRHILSNDGHTPTYALFGPVGWTWRIIFSRSRGETTVREAAPATPPAMKYDAVWADKNGMRLFFSTPALDIVAVN